MVNNTEHSIFFRPSQNMSVLSNESVDLVVTSPPYPMIEMWDEIFSIQNPEIGENLTTNPEYAFELMHRELDKVWNECFRVLKEGGFMCVNIGDATRTINGKFSLYNNHSRIVASCLQMGFNNLPNVIWRKVTNAPNKFMGSGMMPCGAYVTLEHEYILIFRKGEKRNYKSEEQKFIRRKSSFFWEERNTWFSDLWDLKGVKQNISKSKTRERSAAFPLEIPYRLINMYSQIGDVVLDPFMGLGTTTIAAILLERHSAGFEIDPKLSPTIIENVTSYSVFMLNSLIKSRYDRHLDFVKEREQSGKEVGYQNDYLKCKVMTKQETEMAFHYLSEVEYHQSKDLLSFEAKYEAKSDLSEIPYHATPGSLF